MQMIGVRVRSKLYGAIKERAAAEDRSMAWVAREALERAFLKPSRKPARKKREPKGEIYSARFRAFWEGWSALKWRLKGESKARAAEQFEALVELQPEPQRDAYARLLLSCAQEQDRQKTKTQQGGQFAPNFQHLERWLGNRTYQDTNAWREAERARDSATTGAAARSPQTSSDATAGTSDPFRPAILPVTSD